MAYRLVVVLVFSCLVGACVQAMDGSQGPNKDIPGLLDFATDVDGPDNSSPVGMLEADDQDDMSEGPFDQEEDAAADEKEDAEESGVKALLNAAVSGNKEARRSLFGDVYKEHHQLLVSRILENLENREKEANARESEEEAGVRALLNVAALEDEEAQRLFGDIYKKHNKLRNITVEWPILGSWVLENLEDREKKDVWDTVLITAIETCNRAAVQILFDAGIDLNKPNKYRFGCTPLMEAAEAGNEEGVQILLDFGANKDVQHKVFGYTALMRAAAKGHDKIVDLLIRAGAKVDMQSSRGETALKLASKKGNHKVIDLLKGAGAGVHARGKAVVGPALNRAQVSGKSIDSQAAVPLTNPNSLSSWSFPIPGVVVSVGFTVLLAVAALYVWRHKYSQG